MMMGPNNRINILTLNIHACRVLIQDLSNILFDLDLEWRRLDFVEQPFRVGFLPILAHA